MSRPPLAEYDNPPTAALTSKAGNPRVYDTPLGATPPITQAPSNYDNPHVASPQTLGSVPSPQTRPSPSQYDQPYVPSTGPEYENIRYDEMSGRRDPPPLPARGSGEPTYEELKFRKLLEEAENEEALFRKNMRDIEASKSAKKRDDYDFTPMWGDETVFPMLHALRKKGEFGVVLANQERLFKVTVVAI